MNDKLFVPICVNCRTKMLCKNNDFIIGHNDGYNEICWNGDLYNCPQCLIEIVTGFGEGYKVPSHNHLIGCDLRLKCNINSSTKLS